MVVGRRDQGVRHHAVSVGADTGAAVRGARRLVATAGRQALEERVRAARGLRRRRLARELEREEAGRRQGVPIASEFAAAQRATGDPYPDAEQVAEHGGAIRTGPS